MAVYFLGAQQGKSKESGDSWYKVALLLQNRYQQWVSKDYWVPSKVFASCMNQGLAVGQAVVPVFDGSGEKPSLKRVMPDDENDPIVLVPDDDSD